MNVVCLDMEGVLVPEIWIAFAEASARKQGKTVMRFDTGTENEVSNHLYPAIGYHLADVVDTFFMGYTHRPLNLYEKKL